MTRDSFVFYASFYEAMKKMSRSDRTLFVEAICAYALEDETPHLTGNADLAFGLIKPQLDANKKRRENGEKGKGFGKLGGRPKNENPNGVISENPTATKPVTPNVNVNDNVNVYKEESIEKKVAVAPSPQRFKKPTIEEIAAYAASLKYAGFDAQHFFSYYESNGWKVGRNPMKSWKNAVTSWHCKDKQAARPSADYISRTNVPDDEVWRYAKSTL